MNNYIERYVAEVTRRLPEKDREDVKKELLSNIYDMLPENPDDAAVQAVLNKLGSPAELAEKYRQNPRYLISPAYYDEYVRALKWILPLVGCVVMAVGFIIGAVDAVRSNAGDIAYVVSNVLSKGIGMGVSGAFQALVWTTVGFVIAERTGAKIQIKQTKGAVWTVADLPEKQPSEAERISLADGIAELVLTCVFATVAILFCKGALPFAFVLFDGELKAYSLFSAEFLAMCLPVVIVTSVLSVLVAIAKMKDCRWTPLVGSLYVLQKLVSMGLGVFLLTRPFIFSAEFTALMQGFNMPELAGFPWFGVNGMNPFLIFILVVTVISTIVDCSKAIVRTVKGRK